MAYKHKRWVRVDKKVMAKLDQATVNAIRWHAKQGATKIAILLNMDANAIDYVLSNPAFMKHTED